ncbi:MAG: hypothetical protein ACXACC_10370 [Promethearchaeota archaeon]|jgi:hypothetical protein
MYSGVGLPLLKLKKKDEWCEFDLEQAKKFTLFLSGAVALIIGNALFGIFLIIVLFITSNIFILFIIIIILIITDIFITFRFWRDGIKEDITYSNSYSICLDNEKINLENIIFQVKKYLDKNKVKYIFNSNKYKDGTFDYSFKRKDNLRSLIKIWNRIKNEVNICIFFYEFRFLKDKELIKIIWDEDKSYNRNYNNNLKNK